MKGGDATVKAMIGLLFCLISIGLMGGRVGKAEATIALVGSNDTRINTLTSDYICQFTTPYINCDLLKDASGDCAAGSVCMGGHSHSTKADLDSPTFTDDVSIAAAGIKITGADGDMTILGLGDGYDEDLTFDFDTTENTVTVSSSTGVTTVTFGSIDVVAKLIPVAQADCSTVTTAGAICTDSDTSPYITYKGNGTSAIALTSILDADNDGYPDKAEDLVIASQATGDLLYFNGSNWVRFAKGSNNTWFGVNNAGTQGYHSSMFGTGSNNWGVMLWGNSDDTTDTGNELCALGGLTCVDVKLPNGTDSDCTTDQGTSGTYFYALCK